MADGATVHSLFKSTVRGRFAAAQIGFVDDVVMHQGSGLKYFYGTREISHGVTHIRSRAAGLGHQSIEGIQGQQRPQSFASLAGGCGLIDDLCHHGFQGVGYLIGIRGGSQLTHQLYDARFDDCKVVSSCPHD